MFSVNLVLRVKSDKGWVRIPVRKTSQGKFIWDNPEHGVYYLEWYEDGKRKRQAAGLRPAEILDARRRKILELKGRAIENGRTVQPGVSEDSPVPLAATVVTYLNHLKINQKLNTYRRYRSVLDNFRQYFASKKYSCVFVALVPLYGTAPSGLPSSCADLSPRPERSRRCLIGCDRPFGVVVLDWIHRSPGQLVAFFSLAYQPSESACEANDRSSAPGVPTAAETNCAICAAHP